MRKAQYAPMVSNSRPSGEKAAVLAVPFILRLNSSCRDCNDTIATLPTAHHADSSLAEAESFSNRNIPLAPRTH